VAHHLSLQHLAAIPMPNIAEVVLSGFFCPQPWFLQQSEHIFPGKTPACLTQSINNRIGIKVKFNFLLSWRGLVVIADVCGALNWASIVRRED